MPAWKGIVARSFTAAEFADYVAYEVKLQAWRPKFCTLHNTQIPTYADWMKTPGTTAITRIRGLEGYYKNDQHWSAGPHIFVADLIWAFTPLWLPGVHAPSWNGISWGVEMVGDYEVESLDNPVFENTIAVLVALDKKIGATAQSLRLHKEDPLTTHKGCPGKNVDKTNIIQFVDIGLGI